MPAPILGALGYYFSNTLGIQTWPEEVPRYDTSGVAINPGATSSPSIWPAVTIVIAGKVNRDNTFENAYGEESPILITAWGTTREEVETAMSTIEAALVQAVNWAYQGSPIGVAFVTLGFPQYWLFDMEVGQWTSQQRQLERLADSQLCWTAEMDMIVKMHGQIKDT